MIHTSSPGWFPLSLQKKAGQAARLSPMWAHARRSLHPEKSRYRTAQKEGFLLQYSVDYNHGGAVRTVKKKEHSI